MLRFAALSFVIPTQPRRFIRSDANFTLPEARATVGFMGQLLLRCRLYRYRYWYRCCTVLYSLAQYLYYAQHESGRAQPSLVCRGAVSTVLYPAQYSTIAHFTGIARAYSSLYCTAPSDIQCCTALSPVHLRHSSNITFLADAGRSMKASVRFRLAAA